ncbi:hypothetical protein, partial [Duganella sp. Root336D2]|uniref:hypothetical protein n=1 Tax=Duganella sp. Root336D2 TaxID=1736518 RepID=UPI001E2BEFE6
VSDLAVGNYNHAIAVWQAEFLKLFLNVAIKSGIKETLVNSRTWVISYSHFYFRSLNNEIK